LQDILEKLTDEEIEPINEVMLDKTKDIRYYAPQTYMYLSVQYPELKSPKKVLISLVDDPLVRTSDREYALTRLEKLLSPEDKEAEEILLKLWEPSSTNNISSFANRLLITIFHNEKAIEWRFEQLKKLAAPFQQSEGSHSVGDFEMELTTRAFAQPLINLNDEKYLGKYIDLLDYSLTFAGKPEYQAYTNYLWNIALNYVARDDFLLSPEALASLRAWTEEHSSEADINWFQNRIKEISSRINTVAYIIRRANARASVKKKPPIEWTYPKLWEELSSKGAVLDIDLFLSHASAGKNVSAGETEFVTKLDNALQKTPLKPFLDADSEARTIDEKVEIALTKSKFLVIVGSERYCRRINVDKARVITMEKQHFLEIEDVAQLPLIFIVTYKMDKNDWKLHAPPSLKGGREQVQADFHSDEEVEKVVKKILDWVGRLDSSLLKKDKK